MPPKRKIQVRFLSARPSIDFTTIFESPSKPTKIHIIQKVIFISLMVFFRRKTINLHEKTIKSLEGVLTEGINHIGQNRIKTTAG